jgi:hypothetical protein
LSENARAALIELLEARGGVDAAVVLQRVFEAGPETPEKRD